jgi:hypothetical protein
MEPTDEVSYTQYRHACRRLSHLASNLEAADPDEAVEHYLPLMTREIALIFSFVGSNATMRHLHTYARTVADLQAAKEGKLPDHNPQEERDG